MSTLVQLLASGLAVGVVYALVALGFVVVYRASRVFNFAQGELASLGAFALASLSAAGLPWPVALPLALLAVGLVGAGIERAVLRPLVGRPVHVSIILTILVAFVLRTVIVIAWGTHPRGQPTPWEPTSVVALGGARVLTSSLVAVAAGVLALALFFLVVRYTRLGLGMRATSLDQEAALSLGIPVGQVLAGTWFVAGAYAALGGAFLSVFPRSVEPNLGLIALRAFPAVVVGGLESVWGCIAAGLLLGVLEVLTQGYVNARLGPLGQSFHAVLPYLVMILVLVIRPRGLFGRAEVERI